MLQSGMHGMGYESVMRKSSVPVLRKRSVLDALAITSVRFYARTHVYVSFTDASLSLSQLIGTPWFTDHIHNLGHQVCEPKMVKLRHVGELSRNFYNGELARHFVPLTTPTMFAIKCGH